MGNIKLKSLICESIGGELEEDAGQLHFKNLIRQKDPSKLIQRSKTDRQNRMRRLIQKSRGDDIDIDNQSDDTAQGAVITPHDSDIPLYGYSKNDDGTPAHEGFHYIMSMIDRQYGDTVYKKILDDLTKIVIDIDSDNDDPKYVTLKEKLSLYLTDRNYKRTDNPYAYKEELVTVIRDIAVDGKHQKSFWNTLTAISPVLKKATKEKQKAYFNENYLYDIRWIWREMLQYSRDAKIEDLKK